MALPRDVDVAVVGAGSAGAATAWYFARRGARVLCLERRDLTRAGARWVNGVTRAALTEAGIELRDPAVVGGPHRFWLTARSGRVLIADHDVLEIDMRGLVAALQANARDSGAELRGDIVVRGRDGNHLHTDEGTVRARWIVDASGLAGAKLLDQEPVAPAQLCAAAQEVRTIRDRAAALEFCERAGVAPGDVIGYVGVAGGFSIRNVRVSADGERVGILTGSIPALGVPSGKALLEEFVAAQPWVGERIFGGAGAIPLRRPYDRLATECVALVGDAACQVFPAHGSGVGAGILAGKLLAETLAAGGTLRDYEVGWHRRFGGLFGVYNAVRRWNSELDGDEIATLFALGVVDPVTARAGLDQTMPSVSLGSLGAKAHALLQRPTLLPGVAKATARMSAAKLLSAVYPRSIVALEAWRRGMDRVLAA